MAHTGRPAHSAGSTHSSGVDVTRREFVSTSPNEAAQDTTVEMTRTSVKDSTIPRLSGTVTEDGTQENTGKAS